MPLRLKRPSEATMDRAAATRRERLEARRSVTDFERVRAALVRGEANDRLLDGRDFDHRYWINAKAALGRIERRLRVAEGACEALRAVVEGVE